MFQLHAESIAPIQSVNEDERENWRSYYLQIISHFF